MRLTRFLARDTTPLRSHYRRTKTSVLAAVTLTLLSGCYSFGPDHIRGTHPLYNAAVVDAGNEQLLNNLVRLRYRDPTAFLDVSSIASTTKLTLKADATGELSPTSSGVLGLGGGYETYPTISYSPLQGEDFSKRLLSPVSINALFSLTLSGWALKRVFGICVEEINDIPNAPTASGPTPEGSPRGYDKWNRFATLLDHIHDASLIKTFEDSKTGTLKVKIKEAGRQHLDIIELKEMLRLSPQAESFLIKEGSADAPDDSISVVTRSLMSTLFYLSHSIDVPPEDLEIGRVTTTRYPDGTPFDWRQTPAGRLFHVEVSETRPDLAFIATPYRDHWFYIADNDLESKSTFLLLTQLFRLQAGATRSQGPTLTLPVR